MIEKMTFISIAGLKDDLDRVINTYISKYDIQLENALDEFSHIKGLVPYIEENPYKKLYSQTKQLQENLNITIYDNNKNITIEKADEIIQKIQTNYDVLIKEKMALDNEEKVYREQLSKIEQFVGLNYSINNILHFTHIRFRFGRIEREYYDKFSAYIYDDIDSIFYKCSETKDYIWGVYFVPASIHKKIDAIYTSMHFERFYVPENYDDTPRGASLSLQGKIYDVLQQKSELAKKIDDLINKNKDDFISAYNKIEVYHNNFNIRKLAACTKNTIKKFYVICGWMEKESADLITKELESDPNAFIVHEDDIEKLCSTPPTKLINNKLFKPYELLIELYGLPNYNEIDPTILIGVLYSVFFGFMFGDFGQGLLLMIVASYFAKKYNSRMIAIIARCGFCSAIFGLLFGSVFGFENIIPALWLRPAKAITQLHIIGNLNTVFVITISLGMILILATMILNIVNVIKSKQTLNIIFDTNGIAGMVFYISICILLIASLSGLKIKLNIFTYLLFIIPLLLIFFKEPILNRINKHKEHDGDGPIMFIVQGFFEMIEILLSFFSNTISFVRIGAFAISHAAMMEVILMLSGYEQHHTNWLVIIIGNLFVMGVEGLIVGIQVLRLQYYEIFSRFYKGNGRAFIPYGKTTNK